MMHSSLLHSVNLIVFTLLLVHQEKSEHNEVDGMKKGADSTGEVLHI